MWLKCLRCGNLSKSEKQPAKQQFAMILSRLTSEISSAQASAADVIPAVVALTRPLSRRSESDSGVQTAKCSLLEAVCARFDDIQSEAVYAIASMLDAHYKDRYFDMEKKEIALLLNAVNQMASSISDDGEHADAGAGDTPPKKKARTGTLMDMYEEIIEENILPEHASTSETASQLSSNDKL